MKQLITLACDRLAIELSIKILLALSYPTLKVEGLATILYIRFLADSCNESAQFIYGDAEIQTSRGFEIIPYPKLGKCSNFRLFDLNNLIGLGRVDKRWNQPAIAEQWKTVFMLEKMVKIDFIIQIFSEQEFERIKLGIFPLAMEDKWFVYFESGHLYCHRSWTGICIFDVQIETIGNESITTQVLVNNDEDQKAYSSSGNLYSIFNQMREEARVLYS